MHPVTAFASIEADKENILPISQGRSASKLQELSHKDPKTLKQHLDQQRTEFENNLKPEILQDLDDPLDLYIQYIKWIRENYTTGNTNESLLVQVLERTTHDFKDDEYYKNEIRYFKIWLEYITYSDHPGDVFNYLLKKKIGSELSLFYENYSLFYELNDQWDNANQILLLGISKNARPYKRLLNSYESFKVRKSEKEAKISCDIPVNSGLSNPNGLGLNTNKINTNKKKKLQIFSDSNSVKSFTEQNVVAHLDSIQNSKKENISKPSSWKGEVLKVASLKTKNIPKLEVLNDKTLQYPITKSIRNPNGKHNETYDLNFDLFMPKSNQIMSMLEVLLSFQKPFDKSINNVENVDKSVNIKRSSSKCSLYDTPVPKKAKTNDENDEQLADSPGIQDTPLLEYFRNSKGLFSMNEDDDNFDNNTNNTSNNRNTDLIVKNGTQKSNEKSKEDLKPEETNDTENNLLNAIIGGQFSDVFTDNTASKINEAKTPPRTKSKISSNDDLLSSPFVENPKNDSVTKNSSLIQNPYDSDFKRGLNKQNSDDLYKNPIFYNLSDIISNKITILQNIFKPNSAPIYGNKQTLLEFGNDDLYCITKELGRGKHSIIYLSEKMDAQLFAIKINSPPDIWESSILLKLNQISNDFMNVQSVYKFNDELHLVLPYFKQGSIYDMVNCLSNYHSITTKNLIDETLVIYLTIQVLANMLKLHSLGIIHGNLNSGKFMLNFQYSNINKLTFKDLVMIDFGDSVDLSLYPKDTKFQTAFENTHNNNGKDCIQFANSSPWCYEPDYFGVAKIIHSLLFNKSIKFQQTSNGIQIIESIKKYWQTERWNELFNVLLNPKLFNSDGDVTNEIERIKGKLESWFNLTVDKRLFLNKLRTITEILENRCKKNKG